MVLTNESPRWSTIISVTKHCPDLQMEKASVGVSSVLAKDPVFGLNVMFVKLCDWEGREENYTNCYCHFIERKKYWKGEGEFFPYGQFSASHIWKMTYYSAHDLTNIRIESLCDIYKKLIDKLEFYLN